jgi:glyoxylase-like metal-dependent hydrolase (beta-lactamase superfamily II)
MARVPWRHSDPEREEGSEVAIVDAAVPGYWSDLLAELAAMGRALEDVRAVALTTGHSDHIGFAERGRRETGVPVRVHDIDAALARGEVPNPWGGVTGWGRGGRPSHAPIQVAMNRVVRGDGSAAPVG